MLVCIASSKPGYLFNSSSGMLSPVSEPKLISLISALTTVSMRLNCLRNSIKSLLLSIRPSYSSFKPTSMLSSVAASSVSKAFSNSLVIGGSSSSITSSTLLNSVLVKISKKVFPLNLDLSLLMVLLSTSNPAICASTLRMVLFKSTI